MAIGRRIAQARKEAGLSQQAVANRFGISRAAVAQWENGDTFPGSSKLEGLADVLGVSLEWIATGRGAKQATAAGSDGGAGRGGVPVIAMPAATLWPQYPPGGIEGVAKISTEIALGPNAFALIIEDQSMSPEFTEGDKVIIDPDVLPQPRDYVVAVVSPDSGPSFRMYRPGERGGIETIELVPFDAAWPTQTIDPENPGRVIGTMVEHRRYRRA